MDNIDSNIAEIQTFMSKIDGEMVGLQGEVTSLEKHVGPLE